MPVIDETIEISRPATDVFDFVVRGENLPHWDSSILECARTDQGPLDRGARYRGATKLLGRRVEWTTEIVEYAVPVRATSVATSGPLDFTVTYELQSTPAGSRLRYHLVAQSGLGGAFGAAMDPIVERAQAKVVRANLATLRHLLEHQSLEQQP